MTISGKTIHAAFRAIVLTGLIGLGGMATPAMAQVPGFGFGPGFDHDDGFFPERIICMSDREIRQAIAGRGYSQIALNVPNDKRIQVRAVKGGTVYLIKFNYCSGRIEDRQALRPAQ
ncbi:MAG TPA: hypothetical protein VL133_07870 [Devosia sp.]|nr:hypothetical protein [Devosia sp.]